MVKKVILNRMKISPKDCSRAMHFLSNFLREFGQGDQTVEDSMNKAYGKTLKRYHGWITRGIFSVILIDSSF